MNLLNIDWKAIGINAVAYAKANWLPLAIGFVLGAVVL